MLCNYMYCLDGILLYGYTRHVPISSGIKSCRMLLYSLISFTLRKRNMSFAVSRLSLSGLEIATQTSTLGNPRALIVLP
jgi:hypothetical protein